MGAMMFLLMRAINTRLSVVLTTSAMRNAHQTIFTLPVRLSSHAIGISTTSWRQTERMRLYTPLPNAWNTELSTMPMPASRKWGQMIRSAGTVSYTHLDVYKRQMEPRIQDGDLALVHKQDTLENGDLGVLVYGDEGEGTLKRYLQRGNCVVLQPFNPAYNEMVIKGEDLNRLHIAGRVVETKAKW